MLHSKEPRPLSIDYYLHLFVTTAGYGLIENRRSHSSDYWAKIKGLVMMPGGWGGLKSRYEPIKITTEHSEKTETRWALCVLHSKVPRPLSTDYYLHLFVTTAGYGLIENRRSHSSDYWAKIKGLVMMPSGWGGLKSRYEPIKITTEHSENTETRWALWARW